MKPGLNNLITDVPGLLVGHATDQTIKSGVTVLTGNKSFVASVEVVGGAPGTRETDLLSPDKMVDEIDAIVLSGGSAMGLDAAGGVATELRRQGRGFRVGEVVVPIVPSAILFDLLNGGKQDTRTNPYQRLGQEALSSIDRLFELGSHGAGTGATTATLKGGLGSASIDLGDDLVVGALMVANPVGTAIHEETGQFRAAEFEVEGELGGRGMCTATQALAPIVDKIGSMNATGAAKANTTIGIVATNARLDKAQAKRLAVAAHDGMPRALMPSHTPFDGDLIFSLSTGEIPLPENHSTMLMLGHYASVCVARAIARGIYLARAHPGDKLPTWQDKWG